jgi:Flp pilus assembly pilin Flp
MAIQNVLGDAARGATWVSIHNGGGCGWGEVINGGFGMVLDGSPETQAKCENMLFWDVTNGVTRRSWAGNTNAQMTILEEMAREEKLKVTMPNAAEEEMLQRLVDDEDGGGEAAVEYDLLFTNCTIATMAAGSEGYGTMKNGVVGVNDGKIAFIGTTVSAATIKAAKTHKDVQGKLMTPGLIDCHTHIVYGGDRALEWELKLQGASYEEVAKAGGGIVNTVDGTRLATVDGLVESAKKRVEALLREGVTSMEIKSGYGLELEAERRQLLAAKEIARVYGIKVQKTFLAAHAIPREYKDKADEYIGEGGSSKNALDERKSLK